MRAAETSENCRRANAKALLPSERSTPLLGRLLRTERVEEKRTVGTCVNTDVSYFFPNRSLYIRHESAWVLKEKRMVYGFLLSNELGVSCAGYTVL